MSNQAVTWAYKQDVRPAGAKFVLVTLANYAGADGSCHPGVLTIAADTSMSERAVRGHLDTLERLGLIKSERRTRKDGTRTSNGYVLVGFLLPAESAGSQPADLAGDRGGDNRQILPSQPADSAPLTTFEPLGEPLDSETSLTLSLTASSMSKRTRPPDPYWDALVDIHGSAPTPRTPEHGRWNKACGIYRACKITPEQIPRAYALYRQRYPNVDVTAIAVAGAAERLLKLQPKTIDERPEWVPYAQRGD